MKFKLSIMAVLSASVAFAQDFVELPEISLSANFDETPIQDTGAQVNIVRGEDVTRNQSAPVSEVLGNQPGVSVSRSGPMGSNTSVLIRGTRQYENKVFVDGIDVTDPSLLQSYYNFGAMTMGTVESMEIVKGSQSAIYGANAVGGVVDIVSQGAQHEGLSGQAGVEGGSYGSLASNVTLAYSDANYEVAVSNAFTQTEGFSAADEANGATEADGFVGDRWHISGSYDINNNLTIGVNSFIATSEGDYDGTDFMPGEIVDADKVAKTAEMGGRAYARYHTEGMSHELSYSRYNITREYDEPFTSYTYEGARDKFAYAGDFNIMDQLSANLRLEAVTESYEQSGDYGDAEEDATTNSAAIGLNYSPMEALDLNLAVRFDDHEIFGSQTSYRLAGAYHLNQALTLKASYGTGYRAPSLYEMNYGATEDLQPETSASYDIGAEYRMAGAVIGASYFNIETDNQITYGGVWPNDLYENIEGATVRSGFEVYGEYAVGENFAINAAYTRITTEDADGERLTNIPADELSLGAQTQFAGFSVAGDMKMVSDTLDRFGEPLDDYMLLNARIGYAFQNGEIYVRAENLLDEDYQTVRGYGTSGAAYYAGFQTKF